MKINMHETLRLTAIAALLCAAAPAGAANECGDVAANGTAADSFTCAAGTYGSGIAYGTNGNLTLTGGGSINVGTAGIAITGNGNNTSTLITTAGTVSGAGGIEVGGTGTGAVTIHAADVEGGITVNRLTGSIDVRSTGGDIAITRLRDVSAESSVSGNMTVVGVGNIDINRAGSGSLTIDSSGGTGSVHVVHQNVNRLVSGSMSGLDATIGSGGFVLDVIGAAPPEGPENPSAAGAVGVSGGVMLRGQGAAEINLRREAFYRTSPTLGILGGILSLDQEYASLSGDLDASDLAGGVSINVDTGAAWEPGRNVVLSSANDMIRIGKGGFLHTPIAFFVDFGNDQQIRTLDFSGGADDSLIIDSGGRVLVGVTRVTASPVPGDFASSSRDTYEAELRLEGLERLVNDGEIWLGTSVYTGGTGGIQYGDNPVSAIQRQGTDRVADDILSAPGTTLVGGPNGRIFLDADLNVIEGLQTRCDASARAANGNLPVADCINLQNGRIEGTVFLSVTATSQGGRGALNTEGNVIIDLSDGNGGPGSGGMAEGATVGFAPESRFYNPAFGGILDTGMFAYHLFYDEATTQVKLIGIPSAGAYHQPIIANAAQSAWRTANGSFFDRQADLRDTLRGGAINDHGVWLRAAYDDGERESRHTFSVSSGDMTYDNTHDLQTSAVTLGVDFIRGGGGDRHWLVGGMLGYVRTDIEYARFWADTAAMNGMLAGLYGSYVSGPLFVDGAVSGTWTRLVQDMPQAELYRERDLSSDLETRGAQLEAGWRFDFGVARVEPLLSATWSQTRMDDIKVPEADPIAPGNQIMFEDTTSTRFGAGLRGSTEFPVFGDAKLGLSLTGRFMNESDGKASAKIGNLNPISPEVVDTWDGTFSELTGGVTLANASGRVSGVLNVGLKSGDDYSATSGSFSFRYQW